MKNVNFSFNKGANPILKNINLHKRETTPLIDEFPALSIAAACGKGKMIMRGLGELRYKESDRFKSISEGLRNAGVQVNTFTLAMPCNPNSSKDI